MSSWFFENLQYAWVLVPVLILLLGEILLRRQPWFLILTRSLWILSLIFLILDLNFLQSSEYRQQGKIFLLVDESDSVSKIPQRSKRAEEFKKEVQEWAKKNDQNVELLHFSESLNPSSWDQNLRGGTRSHANALDGLPQTDEGSVILLSDGNLLGQARLKLPVLAVQIGDSNERDVWFQNVKPVFTAFLKNRIKIPIELAQKGFEGESVRLSLYRGQERLFEEEVPLSQDGAKVEIPYFPEKMGEDLLRAEISGVSGELSDLNNSISFRVRTVRDKIRILHISGRPDIDLKAWRLFLTRQPDVDLVSFYILRSLQDEPGARNSELSLIPFPYQELFSTELEKFDIVILQNFNFNLYFQSFYLRNLADFILKGGALLIFGGDQSLHEYKESPLDPLFPFRFLGAGDFIADPSSAKVLGRHPILRGLENSLESRNWRHRHRLISEPGAEDLVRFADGTPFLSIRQIAEGRVAAWNTDESWRLHFEPSSDSAAFGKIARRLLQYLTFDPEMESNRIQSGPWRAGQKVELSLAQKTEAFWKLSKLKPYQIDYESKQMESKISYLVPEPGVYLVELRDSEGQSIFETEEKPWLNEWKELISQNSKLEQLSQKTGGKFFSYEDREKVFEENISGRQLISAKISPWSRENAVSSWIFLLISLSFLFVDFYLRKKYQWDA